MSCYEEALEILQEAKRQPLSHTDRKQLSIKLAGLMLQEAAMSITHQEKRLQKQLARLMTDPRGKAFTTAMTDECFRSHEHKRVADQIIHLLHHFGIPKYLGWMKRLQLSIFKAMGPTFARFLIPVVTYALRKETANVILPGEAGALTKHLLERKAQGIRLNINRLGEAILSEKEALNRMRLYLEDLKHPHIDYISIKISTIFSQIQVLSFDASVSILSERLRQLYRAAMQNSTVSNGKEQSKFINLDMEEYRDLQLTVAVFQKVLNEPEFQSYSAGIVLQAYLPDSHSIQQTLTQWAKQRVAQGGAPIKIRIVKGANLAMEQFEASLRGWPQAPYTSKLEVDANYKKMVLYGCLKENATAVHLGIASHNLFDIAFAMLNRLENGVEEYVGFEMLEGMADHIRRVVQKLVGDILLYCPVATKKDFQHAIAYLIRRLDENTGPENFLRHVFGLKPGTESWDSQSTLFLDSCDQIDTNSISPRRTQNRLLHPNPLDPGLPFENEPDTDFTLKENQAWAKEIALGVQKTVFDPIPVVINGKTHFNPHPASSRSPSEPTQVLFEYSKASEEQIQEAVQSAKEYEKIWSHTSLAHRSQLIAQAAQKLREQRGALIGAMIANGGKTFLESDTEISEAIDFAEYYRRQAEKIHLVKDIEWKPKGTILVASPWNFPCAIPAGGIFAALATGNCVLFKPASHAVLVGWKLVNAIWDAGIPKQALQFIPCSGEEVGPSLIANHQLDCVILTGGTATAQQFLTLRPGLDLAAETGGKNAIIVTALADRDLAIKDIIQSAFGHAGQKCSACSLLILEKELYYDPDFRQHLKEAAASLKVGPAWNLSTKINPLIHEPKGALKRALTTLDEGEEWLLEPKQDPVNPCLWSPGIKLHVSPKSFTHMTELFGPVLGVMKADHLSHAIELANQVPYGLTSGLHSLDEREQTLWLNSIEAGNLYINRTITGAIVKRQPFGGTKASSFGSGSKAGGPNYLREFLKAKQVSLPQEKQPVNQQVNNLTAFLTQLELSAEDLGVWTASVANYAYWWKRLHHKTDPTKIVGQDNFFGYVPRKGITLRLTHQSSPLDALRAAAALLTCGAEFEISLSTKDFQNNPIHWLDLSSVLRVIAEEDPIFLHRVSTGRIQRVRLVSPASQELQIAAAKSSTHIVDTPVLANGRFELLHYLREVSISCDYHRYGNLGMREGELRKPIL